MFNFLFFNLKNYSPIVIRNGMHIERNNRCTQTLASAYKKEKKKEKGLESCSGGGVGAKLNQKLISFKQEVHTELKPFPEVNIS